MGDIIYKDLNSGKTVRLSHGEFNNSPVSELFGGGYHNVKLTGEYTQIFGAAHFRWQIEAFHPSDEDVTIAEEIHGRHTAWVSLGSTIQLLPSGETVVSKDRRLEITHEAGRGSIEGQVFSKNPELPSGL